METAVNLKIQTGATPTFLGRVSSFASLLGVGFFCAFFSPVRSAHATGAVKVESNGFLRRSLDRSDSTSTLSVGPRLGDSGNWLEGKLELDAIVQVTDTKNLSVDRSAFTVESANAYVATSKKLWSKHQLTLGRRVYDWSKFDDAWQFGTVSPRFIWDPIRPETIGLTGAFYEYKSKHWRVLGYGSALSIPERGYPLRNENGKLLSSNPFFNPYFEEAVIAKRNIPISYHIDYPPMKDLILNAGGALSVRGSTGEEGRGIFGQALYGYLPVHQANLAVAPQYVPAQDAVDVRIHPSIQKHHLLSFETGFTGKKASFWLSQTFEKPTTQTIPANWIQTKSGPASISALGGEIRFHPRWKLSSSFIYVKEDEPVLLEKPEFTIELPGRFPYQRAAKIGLEFQGSERLSYAVAFLDDLAKESQLLSLDIYYNILRAESNLTVNIGSDFFASATGKGLIGQAQGNDRFRGAISYAF